MTNTRRDRRIHIWLVAGILLAMAGVGGAGLYFRPAPFEHPILLDEPPSTDERRQALLRDVEREIEALEARDLWPWERDILDEYRQLRDDLRD